MYIGNYHNNSNNNNNKNNNNNNNDDDNNNKSNNNYKTSLVLIIQSSAGVAGLNLGYPQNPPLKLRKPSYAQFINIFLCELNLGWLGF